MDADSDRTGRWIWRAMRWAVRWRMPDSSVGIEGSGINWTFALRMLQFVVSMTTAPSILDSSRRREAVNGTSRSKPPEHSASTSGV